MSINSFLVKRLKISHKKASQLIDASHIFIDDLPAIQKQFISDLNTIVYNANVLQQSKVLFYYAYYKPVGVESTMNINISNNLVVSSGLEQSFFPVGRLDKASEGLMILTNDGLLYKHIFDDENSIEKVYEVEVDYEITSNFLEQLSTGVLIMGKHTKSCKVKKMETHKFEITLLEGRNRQIRRMCYKLGYEVVSLKRIAISKLKLDDLKTGQIKQINKKQIV